MIAIEEISAEVAHELTVAPGPVVFAVEVIQFLILAAGLGLLVKKMLVPMFEKRRAGVIAELREAEGAEGRLGEAHAQAKTVVAEARRQVGQRVKEAQRRSAETAEEVARASEEEASQLLEQARQTLEQEESDAVNGVRAQLIDLVTIATRRVLEEALSEDERRELVEKSVLSSLEELEDVVLAE